MAPDRDEDDLEVEALPDDEVVRLIQRPELPQAFDRQRVIIPPGAYRTTDAEEWAGALVMVERGELEVLCQQGGHQRFATGDVIVLGWLPLQTIGNPGAVPVELLAVRRAARSPVTRGLLRVIRHIRS